MNLHLQDMLSRLHLAVNPAVRSNVALSPGDDHLYIPVRLCVGPESVGPGGTHWSRSTCRPGDPSMRGMDTALFVQVEVFCGSGSRIIQVHVQNLAQVWPSRPTVAPRHLTPAEYYLLNEYLWGISPQPYEPLGNQGLCDPDEVARVNAVLNAGEDEPIEEPEPEEETPALEEECAACGTELHHSLGEFGNDGDDIEVPFWRFVYDPVCDEMQVDSGSMVCRECLENGSDFEHTVDCFSDDEDFPEDFDQSRESQRAYMESR